MADHRIRLSDADIEEIVRALVARRAGVGAIHGRRLLRLAERLADGKSGNPYLKFDWKSDWNRTAFGRPES